MIAATPRRAQLDSIPLAIMEMILANSDVCPCGSGRIINSCCLKPRGMLLPPKPQTGLMHPKCFARRTRDCSQRLSREHVISRGILRILAGGGPIYANGLPWQPPGATQPLPIDALQSRVLCKRHNESMSPLDALAKRFFCSFPHRPDANKSAVDRCFLFCGHDLERWMIKAACGAICSRYVRGESIPANGWQPSVDWLRVLLLSVPLEPPRGLYLSAAVGESINARPAVQFTLFARKQTPLGVCIALHGFRFFLVMETPEAFLPPDASYRPNEFVFKSGRHASSIVFAWDDEHVGATVDFDFEQHRSA